MSPLYFHYYDAPSGKFHNPTFFANYYVNTTGAVANGVFTVATPGDYYLSFYALGPVCGDSAAGGVVVNEYYKAKSLNFNKKNKFKK